jgi:serine/threonine protein kinase/WD40 repeat protein
MACSVERQLFFQALDKPAGKEREAFLDGACRADPDLRWRLEALLKKFESLGTFLEQPAVLAPDSRQALASTGAREQTIQQGALTEKPGDRIGRYKLLQQIGEGGCGVVYMAEQEEPVRRRVALKVIRVGMDTKNVIARFEAERQALALMDHPNIARVLDAGATDTGRPYFVMELVRGIKITDYCDQNHLPTKQRLELFIQICRAIQHAHQKGIIHRDIKPSNILVTIHDGIPLPKVIDFGIAKATTDQRLTDKTLFTQFEQFIGTPAYMSPEQAEMGGLDIDTRSDIYSLGVLLYELLTGKTPFDSKELLAVGLDEMRRTIREKEPMRPSTRLGTMLQEELTTTAKRRACEAPKLIHALRGDLDWVVMKALEKDRTRRYETANSLLMDLQRHLNHEAVTARPPSQLYRLRKVVWRNRLVFAAAAAVALALLLGTIVSTWQALRATRAKAEAVANARNAKANEKKAQLAQASEAAQRRLAEETGANLRRHLYVADMKAAFQSIQEKKTAQAWSLVINPIYLHPKVTEEDVRGFEWRYLWQASRSPEQSTLRRTDGWTGPTTCATFSPDGKTIAVAGTFTDNVAVIQVSTKMVLTNLGGFDDFIAPKAVTFSPDGRLLAAKGGHDIRVWSTGNWHDLYHWTNGGPNFFANENAVAISHDSSTLATRLDDGVVGFWDLRTGQQREEKTIRQKPHSVWNFGRVVAYSPDGSLLVIADDNQLQIREAASLNLITNLIYGSPEAPPDSLRVMAVAFSTNLLATSYRDGALVLWDRKTWRQVSNVKLHSSLLRALDFAPGEDMLATGGTEEEIAFWRVADLLERTNSVGLVPHSTLPGHDAAINSVMFSPDGKVLASASYDGTARLWSLALKRESSVPIVSDEFVWVSHDGKQLITGQGQNKPRVWDISDEVKSSELKIPDFQRCCKAVSPDGKILAVGRTSGVIELWEPETRTHTEVFADNVSAISQIAFCLGGRFLVTDSAEGVMVHDLSGNRRREVLLEHLVGPFAVSPGGKLLAAPRRDAEEVEICDLAQHSSLGTIETHRQRNAAFAAFSNDGKLLAVPTLLGRLEIWDVKSRMLMKTLAHPGFEIASVAFAPDGRTLVAVTTDAVVLFWNTATWEEITRETSYEYPASGGVAVFSSNGEWLALPGQQISEDLRSILLWHAPTLAEIDATERAKGTNLR